MKNLIRNAFAVTSTTVLVVSLTACASVNTQTISSVDRANLYSSLTELADDSPQVLVGKVTESKVAFDEQLQMNVTLATVDLYGASKPAAETAKTVIVRQTGTADETKGLKFMQTGKVYTIFAIVSDQKANPAREYDIRGVDAGIYEADANISSASEALAAETTYHRLDSASGDKLPASIHLSDIGFF